MKKWQKYTYIPLVSALAVALSGVLLLKSASAAGGQIYLTPASPSVQSGANLALDLRINPGQAVNNVEASVSYDSSKLTFASIDTSSSAFSVKFTESTTTGHVTLQRGTDSINGVTVSGDSRIAILNFTATASSGTSPVTLSSADSYDSNGNTIAMALSNATVSFTAPPKGNGGGGGSGGGGSGTGSGNGNNGGGGHGGGGTSSPTTTSTSNSTTSPVNTATPPTVTDQNIQFTQAVISASSAQPTQVYIRYGTDKNMSQQTATSDFATTHQVSLNTAGLIPGQTYYYEVVSKDQSGAVSQTETRSFTTKGLTISVRVYDKNQKPLANKTVTLHSTPTTGKTDNSGLVTFSNITPGTHHIVYADGSKSYDQQLSVANNVRTVGDSQTAAVQNVSVVYGLTQHNSAATLIVVVALLVLMAGGGVGYYILRNKPQFQFADHAKLNDQPVVIGGAKTAEAKSAPPAVTTHTASKPTAITVKDDAVANDPLSNIPDAERPQPGSTIVPKDSSEGAGKAL